MTPTVLAYLLRYTVDGEFCADPMTIEGQIVVDERHGVVLEILLPALADQDEERVVQIPVEQLGRSIQCFMRHLTEGPNIAGQSSG
jgi:hypothetical protein